MAAVFAAECSSCGEQHECCFAESNFVVQGHEYYYQCPKTGEPAVVLGPVGWHMVLEEKSGDAVELRSSP